MSDFTENAKAMWNATMEWAKRDRVFAVGFGVFAIVILPLFVMAFFVARITETAKVAAIPESPPVVRPAAMSETRVGASPAKPNGDPLDPMPPESIWKGIDDSPDTLGRITGDSPKSGPPNLTLEDIRTLTMSQWWLLSRDERIEYCIIAAELLEKKTPKRDFKTIALDTARAATVVLSNYRDPNEILFTALEEQYIFRFRRDVRSQALYGRKPLRDIFSTK